MEKHEVKFIQRAALAEGTYTFAFERPEGFEFKAGQHMEVTLVNPPETDNEGNIRTFTIASAPHERHLMVATRMRDTAFKRTLKSMPLGTTVEIEGPEGEFILHEDLAKPAIFLIGGIGVTPVRSMVLDAKEKKQDRDLILFFSNGLPQEAPFLSEFLAVTAEYPKFRLITTITSTERSSGWEGERGRITFDFVKKYVPETGNAIFYISGPVGMVVSMKKLLTDEHVAEDRIRTEEFSGY